MNCPYCNKENADDYKYCVFCCTPLFQPAGDKTLVLDYHPDSPTSSAFSTSNLYGRTLDGKYRLEAKLGEGGMGSIFVATRLHIGDKVAVKILRGEQNRDPLALERFRREAQMAAQLKHPSVVAIYDYGVTADNLRYLVMELAEGRNLRQIIVNRGALPLDFIVAVASQICSALDQAHRQGLIHRDIKPDNIIVQETEGGLRVKILDFGVAKINNVENTNLTKSGNIVGTPRYMSPEQCMGEEIDGRSDIYSFGLVLYEMLTSNVPFTAPSSTGLAVQQVTQPPPPLRQFNHQVSSQIEAVVLQSLEKKPDARQQTATQLFQDINNAVYNQGGLTEQIVSPLPANETISLTGKTDILSGEQQPTIASDLVNTGNQEAIRPAFLADEKPNRNGIQTLLLSALIGFFSLVLVGGGILWWMWKPSNTNGNSNNITPNNQTNSTPANTNTPTPTNPADEEFSRLKNKMDSATAAQTPEIEKELKVTESKYPDDYRFTYQLAKLYAPSPNHHEAFEALHEAGRKALKKGQAAQMLNELMSDKDSVFRRLSKGHKEWTVLEDALQNNDETLLTKTKGHH